MVPLLPFGWCCPPFPPSGGAAFPLSVVGGDVWPPPFLGGVAFLRLLWVVVLSSLRLFWAGAVFLGTNTTQRWGRKAARPKEGGGQASPPEREERESSTTQREEGQPSKRRGELLPPPSERWCLHIVASISSLWRCYFPLTPFGCALFVWRGNSHFTR